MKSKISAWQLIISIVMAKIINNNINNERGCIEISKERKRINKQQKRSSYQRKAEESMCGAENKERERNGVSIINNVNNQCQLSMVSIINNGSINVNIVANVYQWRQLIVIS
jgi:hypothetical protein